MIRIRLLLAACLVSYGPLVAAPKSAPKKPASPFSQTWSLADAELQQDFPSYAVDSNDQVWTAYVEWDGQMDRLRLAQVNGKAISLVATLGTPGVIQNPTLATGSAGTLWCFWGQLNGDLMELQGVQIRRQAAGNHN